MLNYPMLQPGMLCQINAKLPDVKIRYAALSQCLITRWYNQSLPELPSHTQMSEACTALLALRGVAQSRAMTALFKPCHE